MRHTRGAFSLAPGLQEEALQAECASLRASILAEEVAPVCVLPRLAHVCLLCKRAQAVQAEPEEKRVHSKVVLVALLAPGAE